MAQNKRPATPQPPRPTAAKAPAPVTPEEPPIEIKPWSIYDFKVQAIIVALLAFIFYINTYHNEYAHDDGIVIVKNEYVLEGFAGIPGILTKDAYDSYYRQLNTTNQLKGGRFRPLSIVTFAIEQQFFGAVPPNKVDSVLKQNISYGVRGPQEQKLVNNMHVRHVFNVVWFALSVIVLLYFLRYIVFKRSPLMAFIATLIFTIHPIHTEVIANVKSRDEILSLLFMCLTFIFTFKYYEKKKTPLWEHLVIILPIILWFVYLVNIYVPDTILRNIIYGVLVGWGGIIAAIGKERREKMIITVVGWGNSWATWLICAVGLIALYLASNQMEYAAFKDLSNEVYVGAMIIICVWLTTLLFFPEERRQKISMLVLALFSFYMAFLSKEYAITVMILLPMSLYLFNRFTIKQSIVAILPFIAVIFVYFLMRYHTMEPVSEGSNDEVLNNPYLYASSTEKLATEIQTCLRYIKLLIFPHPLSADYSYNTIPYVDFTDPIVWLSILVHGGLIFAMFACIKRVLTPDKPGNLFGVKLDGLSLNTARIFAFALMFYFLHFILICNVVFDIGATMGERLIYHSSVGFAICVAFFLVRGAEKIRPVSLGKLSLGAFMVVITVLCGFKTIERNKAWVNDSTLFGTDIKTVPNSVLVSANVAASYITISDYEKNDSLKRDYLNRAVVLLDHTLSIHHKFVAAFLNRGIAWYKLGNPDKAKANMDTVRSLYPTYPVLPGMYKLISEFYGKEGWETYGKNGRFPEAIAELNKGLAIDPSNWEIWANLGGCYFSSRQYASAAYAWQQSLKYNPNNPAVKQALAQAQQAVAQTGGAPPPQAQQQAPPPPQKTQQPHH